LVLQLKFSNQGWCRRELWFEEAVAAQVKVMQASHTEASLIIVDYQIS
jgi:hypothetical protein